MIAIIGSTGQLGRELLKVFGSKAVPIPHDHGGDLLDPVNLRSVIAHVSPAVVINAAAENRVDWCEKNPNAALALNVTGVANLARICQRLNLPMIHFSTDYVFDGTARVPISNNTIPNPINNYGRSKYQGEVQARMLHDKVSIVRTSALYAKGGSRSKGTNFVDFVAAAARRGDPLSIVKDQTVSPTRASDLAKVVQSQLSQLIDQPGVYHAANDGVCTWAGFANAIMALTGKYTTITAITSINGPNVAPRPTYSALCSNFALPRWEDAVRDYLA